MMMMMTLIWCPCNNYCRTPCTEEIRSVSSPKSINPVMITSELVGVAAERSANVTAERQRVSSQSSSNNIAPTAGGGGGGSSEDVALAKKPRHYLSGTCPNENMSFEGYG